MERGVKTEIKEPKWRGRRGNRSGGGEKEEGG